MKRNSQKFLGTCLGDCVHVAGILNFFQIAEEVGYTTEFLGPANSIHTIISAIKASNAQNIAISYRLTPEIGETFIKDFISNIKKEKLEDRTYFIGGLPDLIQRIKPFNFFSYYFVGGESIERVISILRDIEGNQARKKKYPCDLVSRINFKSPYPIIRAHFGLPSLDQSIKGIQTLAQSAKLDVISLAPDQPAQEWLQHPDILKTKEKGAGGIPIRSNAHLNKLFRSSRDGNYPLLRIYSGTQDLIENGKLFKSTINNAWAAIPIFWYSQLDGRGPKNLHESIIEHFQAIRWHAEQKIPVEINDPHQWGLRMAPDHFVVADAFISAYIAKQLGVKVYIEQFMFNTPAGNSYKMDLARVLAMKEIVESLIDSTFTVLRETRAGLAYFSPNPNVAKGQLASSTLFQLALKPHILHVVSYCEANHAAQPEDIIESCEIIERVIQDSMHGLPNFEMDPDIVTYKTQLLAEADFLLKVIDLYGKTLGHDDPLLSPEFLSHIVEIGLLDAPQLRGNTSAHGKICSRIIGGKTIVVDSHGLQITEYERISQLSLPISLQDIKNPMDMNTEREENKEELL